MDLTPVKLFIAEQNHQNFCVFQKVIYCTHQFLNPNGHISCVVQETPWPKIPLCSFFLNHKIVFNHQLRSFVRCWSTLCRFPDVMFFKFSVFGGSFYNFCLVVALKNVFEWVYANLWGIIRQITFGDRRLQDEKNFNSSFEHQSL